MRSPPGEALRVAGVVQGVGFRPFVHRLAHDCGLTGDVCNDEAGVRIRIFGDDAARERFRRTLEDDPPPLARIASIRAAPIPDAEAPDAFRILASEGGGAERAVAVTPDAGICDDCRRELLDPADRRHRYPFINCTNCGPRYTIVQDVPYDRPKTTMRSFAMCDACRAEYEDPADRRFHAQPVCCPACGPHVRLLAADGSGRDGDPVRLAASRLRSGAIVAIKGLGGFHLACDAADDAAVLRLRERKRRDEKPFAVMAGSVEAAARLVELPAYGPRLLRSPESPILIAPRRGGAGEVAPSVAPGNDHLGVMIPYTPLHVLLFEEGLGPLVMTSGNLSDEPIAIGDAEALDRLRGVADAYLLHDRPIDQRCDDSVLLAAEERPVMVRRSRGYVPAGIETGRDIHGVLALGPLLKCAPALGRRTTATPGQHVGDLDHPTALAMFDEVRDRLIAILGVEPSLVACDLHPDYPTTRMADASDLPVVRVQHHHAHLVSLMAEKQAYERAIGFAYDGTGYGPDGTIWGGEALVFDALRMRRAFHLTVVPQPGGDAAAREPWRMAVAHLHAAGLDPARYIEDERVDRIVRLLESDAPQPATSSMGRFFDAVSAMLGLCAVATYEAKAPMRLEGCATDPGDSYPAELGDGVMETAPVIRAVAEDIDRGEPAGVIAGRFHNTVIELTRRVAGRLRKAEGLETVCLSGGAMVNRYLGARLPARLRENGFTVHTHSLLPANDGGVAVGQMVVAAARREAGKVEGA